MCQELLSGRVNPIFMSMEKQFEIFSATKPFGGSWVTGYFKTREEASGWCHVEKFDATSIAESENIDNLPALLKMLNAHWQKSHE